MMTIKKIVFSLSVVISTLLVSCEVTNFDLQDDPNSLTPISVSPDFLLNEIQIRFEESLSELSRNTNDVMRYEAMSDTYSDVAEPSALNGEWSDVYALRENMMLLNELVDEDEDLRFHRGIAKVLHAYSMATLVDYLGDIPFSEANAGGENFDPVPDDDAAIYMALLDDLELAIEDLNNVTFVPLNDLYFDGDATRWIKLANSLKLKLWLNIGDTAQVNALLIEDNLIETIADDFQFQYSATATPADSRHPLFGRGYEPGGQSEYLGNYFIWLLKDSKELRDPRLRYYMYRQTDTAPAGDFLNCEGNPIYDFCYTGDFYWGRDHGDAASTPNDRFLKTIYGLYPSGGAFDANNPVAGQNSINLGGAGIMPILTSFHINFFKAEAVLRLGANGDAATSLETGIRNSMQKVMEFDPSSAATGFAASQEDVNNYVVSVMEEYAVAANADARLNIVIRELYLATYGNSIESYNAYRRTGFPANIQIPIINESIPFPRTFAMPLNPVNRNSSLNQRPITTQVFWDTNPSDFIN